MRVLLVVGFMAACDPVIHVTLGPQARDSLDLGALGDASEILGIPIEVTDHRSGSIAFALREACEGRFSGEDVVRDGCQRGFVGTSSPVTIAHEIGHTLHLDHVDDPANLMSESGSGSGLTEAQRRTLHDETMALMACP